MLFISANMIHKTNIAPKPDQNVLPDVLPINNAAKNAMAAATHQGNR
jgi:hypothetical protein